MLPEAQELVEKFMSERPQRSFENGRSAEKAANVLEVLDGRGLVVAGADRERILTCKELETLARWRQLRPRRVLGRESPGALH
jgi:hypothetical protein